MSIVWIWLKANPRTAGAIGILLVIALAAGGLYLKGRHDEHQKNEAAHAIEVQEALASDEAADTKSVAIAKQHADVAAAQKEELIDAVAQAPDGLPDRASVLWGCSLMCQQGGRPSDIPACRAAGYQARAGLSC